MSFVPFTGDGTLSTGDFSAIGQGVSGQVSSFVKTFANSPKSVRDSMINRGPNQILADIGINPSFTQVLKDKNELITQIGLGAASNIFDNAVNGTLNAGNADLFSNFDSNVSLFNADSDGFNGTPGDILNLTNLSAFSSVLNKTILSTSPFSNLITDYRSGAQEMVDLGFIPKNEYTYVLTVQFDPKFAALPGLSDLTRTFIFLTKTFPRPSIRIENRKVNMYNYRALVPIKSDYEPLTITFIDDNRNTSMRTFMMLLKTISPIFNVANPHNLIPNVENAGMDFGISTAYRGVNVNAYAGGIGPLQSMSQWTNNRDIAAITAIQYFRLYHLFDYGRSVNVYQYYRPRPTSVTMSRLSMSESQDEGAEIEMQFDYEAAYVEEGRAAATSSFPNRDPVKGVIEKSFAGDQSGAHMQTRPGSGLIGGQNSNFDIPLGKIAGPINVQSPLDKILQNPTLPDFPEIDPSGIINDQLSKIVPSVPEALDEGDADNLTEKLQGSFEPQNADENSA